MDRHLSHHKLQSSRSPAQARMHTNPNSILPQCWLLEISGRQLEKSPACALWHLILYHPNDRVALKLHDQCGSCPGRRGTRSGRMSTAAACTSGTLGAPPSVSSAYSPSPLLPCHPSASLSPSGLRPGGSCVAGCWWARSGRGKPLGRLGNAASAETGAGCSCAPHAGSGAARRQTGEEKQLDLSIYLSMIYLSIYLSIYTFFRTVKQGFVDKLRFKNTFIWLSIQCIAFKHIQMTLTFCKYPCRLPWTSSSSAYFRLK